MKVIAVVVTYNRLSLLQECLPALLGQTRPLDEIIVVNNCSTDGTKEYIASMAAAHPVIKPVTLKKNVGGAGGFERGSEDAARQHADYVWLMDDDTIPTPTALEALLREAESHPNAGFLASRVNWKDGEPHLMNIPLFKEGKKRLKLAHSKSTINCTAATFVSLLIPGSVIHEVGLPIGEYFIWHDDIEYTQRIARAGYEGLYVPSSVVLHSTETNRGATIEDAPLASANRFYYQLRNQMATKRMRTNYISFRISSALRLRRFKRAISRRDDHHDEFLAVIKRAYRDGLKFNPKIKHV